MRLAAAGIMLACVVLQGCAALMQEPDTVLVRPPDKMHLMRVLDSNKAPMEPKAALAQEAALDYEYALMSDSAYFGSAQFPVGAGQWVRLATCGFKGAAESMAIVQRENPRASDEEMRAPGSEQTLLAAQGWKEWPPFLTDATWCVAVKEGVAFKVFQRDHADGGAEIVVAFRGTVFSYPANWKANFAWVTNTFGNRTDAYSVVRGPVAQELLARLRQQFPEDVLRTDRVKIATTGHSLGGSLAQHLAYAFPPEVGMARSHPGLKVREITVFDPSPVNGWVHVAAALRAGNAGNLPVRRVYQHGEFLALARLPLSYVYSAAPVECAGHPEQCEPLFSEVKYWTSCDADPKFSRGDGFDGWNENMVSSHAIQLLACGLATAANHKPQRFMCLHQDEIAPKQCPARMRE
ncbi:hypothetical protein BH11PSE7_BH11PSE7_16380 [soil metagenome]